ncbi:MAG: condensation domain-containing protein, partial [Nostoc sp.]
YGLFKIKSLYFAPGIHLVGSCLWLGLVTFNKQLFCSFAHVVPIVSTETAELLADSVIATMEQACIHECSD